MIFSVADSTLACVNRRKQIPDCLMEGQYNTRSPGKIWFVSLSEFPEIINRVTFLKPLMRHDTEILRIIKTVYEKTES